MDCDDEAGVALAEAPWKGDIVFQSSATAELGLASCFGLVLKTCMCKSVEDGARD